jgi:hypothetical protein
MQSTLPWILATFSAALLVGAAILWRSSRGRLPQPALPTEWAVSARPVFSPEERRVYRQLCEALPHHIVLAKMPLMRFCQPVDPQEVRYWYDLLGGSHVSFAICTPHGRVLAAIDLDNERSPSRRSSQIKQSVLAACRVRYLRCPAEHLPSIPELQLLVPQAAAAARGPQAATAATYGSRDSHGTAHRRREFTTLWEDSAYMQDSSARLDAQRQRALFRSSRLGLREMPLDLDDVNNLGDVGGVVIETPHDSDLEFPSASVSADLPAHTTLAATASPLHH